MNDNYEYLSDEELEKLISDTEAFGLLNAPPGFEKSILEKIDNVTSKSDADQENTADDSPKKIISFDERKKQFSRFRFQVCMAMAAAILLMVIAPMAMNTEGGRQFTETAKAMRTERKQETNFVAGFLGNHAISDAMSVTGFINDMED